MIVRRAIGLSFIARYGSLGLRTCGLVATARLLSPESFGVFATATALTGLIFVFVEFGLHNYLIQVPRLARRTVRAAVGVCCVAVAAGLGALVSIVWLLSGAVVDMAAAELLPLMCLAAASQPLTLPVYAKLHRELRFDLLLRVDLLRALASVATTVTLAAAGFGVVSLAWGVFADAAVSVAAALVIGDWRRPAWPSLRGWRQPAGFGLPFAAVGGIGRVGEAGLALLLGQFLGMGAVGLYNRALKVTEIMDKAFIQALSPVVLPALARRLRAGGDLKPMYLRKVTYLTAIQWPFFAVLALLAAPVVDLVLGPAWHGAVPVVQALALGGLFLPFTDLSLKFFVALGEHRWYVAVQAVAVGVQLLLVAALAPVSLAAAAFGIAIAGGFRALLITQYLKRRLGCRWGDYARPLLGAALASAVAAAAPLAAAAGLFGHLDAGAATLAAILAAFGWCAALVLGRHPVGDELRHLAGTAWARARPAVPTFRNAPGWRS